MIMAKESKGKIEPDASSSSSSDSGSESTSSGSSSSGGSSSGSESRLVFTVLYIDYKLKSLTLRALKSH